MCYNVIRIEITKGGNVLDKKDDEGISKKRKPSKPEAIMNVIIPILAFIVIAAIVAVWIIGLFIT